MLRRPKRRPPRRPRAVTPPVTPPVEPWRWTGNTAQALVLVRELAEGGGTVDQDRLARALAAACTADTHRGHGASLHDVLHRIDAGEPGRDAVAGQFGGQFGGQGSWGNGARCHAHRPARRLARRRPRHGRGAGHHPEAVAGAVPAARIPRLRIPHVGPPG
nr:MULTISPECIES: ADP-ribosylglycohydrolase family protein [unclassified Streptomyces]